VYDAALGRLFAGSRPRPAEEPPVHRIRVRGERNAERVSGVDISMSVDISR
jgi:hypothetical protein